MNPSVRVVSGVLFDGQGRLFVQRRPLGKEFGGKWETPGGKVDPSETPSEALAREWSEELGVEIDVGEVLQDFYLTPPTVRTACYLSFFSVSVRSGGFEPREGQSDFGFYFPSVLLAQEMTPGTRIFVEGLSGTSQSEFLRWVRFRERVNGKLGPDRYALLSLPLDVIVKARKNDPPAKRTIRFHLVSEGLITPGVLGWQEVQIELVPTPPLEILVEEGKKRRAAFDAADQALRLIEIQQRFPGGDV